MFLMLFIPHHLTFEGVEIYFSLRLLLHVKGAE